MKFKVGDVVVVLGLAPGNKFIDVRGKVEYISKYPNETPYPIRVRYEECMTIKNAKSGVYKESEVKLDPRYKTKIAGIL